MEYILGVKDNKRATSGALASLSENAIEADIQYDTEGNDKARTRYQRQFWEPVPEGQVCFIMCCKLSAAHSVVGCCYSHRS